MPCIQLTTNKTVGKEKKIILKQKLGKAIEILPRKSEQWLMCVFQPACDIWFQGEEKEAAYIEVGIFGQPNQEDCGKLTERLTTIIQDELNIQKENIYINYSVTPFWGWNGKNL